MIDLNEFYENRSQRKLDNRDLQEGEICVLVMDANHKDFMESVMKPDDYPTLSANTPVEFVEEWEDERGRWFRVVTYWGQTYDLPPHTLERQQFKI